MPFNYETSGIVNLEIVKIVDYANLDDLFSLDCNFLNSKHKT